MEIREGPYVFSDAVRDDGPRRAAFDALARQTFSLSFETWWKEGWWTDRYRPYTLFDGGNAVANVSVNVMDFRLGGETKRWVQLGTVMTAPEYRGRGLSRRLMERVLADWEGRCGLMYLFANDGVLGFYPRFGFHRAEEREAVLMLPANRDPSARKLRMDLERDRELLLSRYGASNPYSAFSMERNPGLLMFYCTQFLRDSVWYVEEADAAVVARMEGESLLCWDVFGGGGMPLPRLLSAAAGGKPCRCTLGFTPRPEAAACGFQTRRAEDETLFVRGPDRGLLEERPVQFPLLSHA